MPWFWILNALERGEINKNIQRNYSYEISSKIQSKIIC